MCRFIIDLKAVLDKFNDTKKRLNDGVKVCAVVKANAYGFGIEKITKLLENRVDYFAVARISEFLKIKKNGIKTPVLILSPLLDKDLKIAIKNGAEITVNSLQIAENIENIAKQNNMHAKVHVKVDSGMNRYGFKDFKEYKETLKFIKKGKNIELVGVYSHFYDSAEDVTDGQFDVFEKYKKAALRSKLKPIFHIASSATLSNKKYQLDMVRLGIDLYLSDKHSLESRVLQLKDVKCGERISYAGTFVAGLIPLSFSIFLNFHQFQSLLY